MKNKESKSEHHYRSKLIENLQEVSRHAVEMTNDFLFPEMNLDMRVSVFLVTTEWSRQIYLHVNEAKMSAAARQNKRTRSFLLEC
jgi:hypothetical protein